MPIQTINPATGETLRTFDALTDAEVDARLERAEAAFQEYRHSSFARRAAWMTRAAEILEEGKVPLARLMTTEMGKPLAAAVAEVEKCACGHAATTRTMPNASWPMKRWRRTRGARSSATCRWGRCWR